MSRGRLSLSYQFLWRRHIGVRASQGCSADRNAVARAGRFPEGAKAQVSSTWHLAPEPWTCARARQATTAEESHNQIRIGTLWPTHVPRLLIFVHPPSSGPLYSLPTQLAYPQLLEPSHGSNDEKKWPLVILN